MVRASLWNTSRIRDSDKGRKIITLGSQRIRGPSPHAGKTVQSESSAHLVFCRAMGVAFGGHRMDETHFVGHFSEMRKQVGNVFAAFSTWLEIVRAFN